MKDDIAQCVEHIEKTILDLEDGSAGALHEAFSGLGLAHVKLASSPVIALMDMLADGITPVTPGIVSALLGIVDAHKRLLYTLAGHLDASGTLADAPPPQPRAAAPKAIPDLRTALGPSPGPASGTTTGAGPAPGPAGSPAPPAPGQSAPDAVETAPPSAPPTPPGQPLAAPNGQAAPPGPGTCPEPPALPRPEAISSIRVNTEKLDSLIELVGKLLVTFAVVAQDDSLHGRVVAGLKEMDLIINQIKTEVEHIRLVPLRQIFTPMHRLVTSLAQKTGKKVRLEVAGEDLELDKKLVEAINEPLVHLLRNAVDHGLEDPGGRAMAGKDETGTIRLGAARRGEFAALSVTDDGRGLDVRRIEEKARERGLWDETATYTREEIFQFIMHSGFSTAPAITDVSGRGVGMDAVLTAVKERLDGEVGIESQPGAGTTFTLSIPLSRAVDQGISDGLVCAVGQERFILPSRDVLEIYQPAPSDITALPDGREVMNVRDRLHGLIRLGAFLGLEDQGRPDHEKLVVVAKVRDRQAAILVDEVLRQQQVVITGFTVPVHSLYGLPILGYGMMGENDALVINVEELLRLTLGEE